jgi:hypothetical protein
VNTKRNIFAATSGQVFARDVFLPVGQITAAWRSITQRPANRLPSFTAAMRRRNTREPVIERAYEIDHHDLGFKRLNGSRNRRMDRRSQLGFAAALYDGSALGGFRSA